MRQALQSAPRFAQVSASLALPAPTGGWNARDNWANMEPTDAVQMDNWIPDVNCVRLRRGDTSYATGLGDNVETLVTHISPSAEKFLGIAGGSVFDISSSGAVGAALATGLSNSRFIWDNFGGVTILVNGADVVKSYNGTAISNPAFTGVTLTDLDSVTQVRNRLWFTEKNSANVWYGGIGSITGALTEFQLDQVATGGNCVRVASWSRDSGDGMDDLTVFIMSTGQVIVYQGDPATTFTLVGRFRTAPPIGKRCFVQRGGDLVIITRGGYVSLSLVFVEQQGQDFSVASTSLSSKIRNAVKEAVDSHGGNFGWEAYRSPDDKFLVFNIPLITNSSYEQHVFNLYTGAWCRFKDRDARAFGTFENNVYFGGNGTVFRADDGNMDVSNSSGNIIGTTQQAFSRLSESGNMQVVAMFPAVEAGGTADVTFAALSDFDTSGVTSNLQSLNSSLQTWDQIAVNWNEWDSLWNEGAGIITPNITAHAEGDVFSVVAQINTNNFFNWYSTVLVFQQAGLI